MAFRLEAGSSRSPRVQSRTMRHSTANHPPFKRAPSPIQSCTISARRRMFVRACAPDGGVHGERCAHALRTSAHRRANWQRTDFNSLPTDFQRPHVALARPDSRAPPLSEPHEPMAFRPRTRVGTPRTNVAASHTTSARIPNKPWRIPNRYHRPANTFAFSDTSPNPITH
jgi:hypothetical protein